MKGVYNRKAEKVRKDLEGISKWLFSRGGRTAKDLLQDKKGLYVIMSDGWGGDKKIYIPFNYK